MCIRFSVSSSPLGGFYFHKPIASRKMDSNQFINKVIEDLKTTVPNDEERTAFTGKYKHMIDEANLRYVYECAGSHNGQYFLHKVIMSLVHDLKNCEKELDDQKKAVPKQVARKRWNAEVFKHMEANAKKQRCVLS